MEDSVIEFLTDFIKEAINQLKDELIFFVVFDNASMMDSASWQLFEYVTGSCEHLVMILCLQTPLQAEESCSENFKISEHAQLYYQEHILPLEETLFHQMELESLTAYDLREMILDAAEDYEISMLKEIELITAIIDPVLNQVKTVETQNELRKRLYEGYQV